jgi:hypothetical protein
MFGMINSKYKTTMCRHFEQSGACQMGARCHFAHGKEELRKVSDPITAMPPQQMSMPKMDKPRTVPMQAVSQQAPGSTGFPTPSNYKTVKCKYFEKALLTATRK